MMGQSILVPVVCSPVDYQLARHIKIKGKAAFTQEEVAAELLEITQRIYDEDAGEGTYNRIRADLFSWAGKRRGGWLATCDEMPSGDPSEDPVEDTERPDEYGPEV